MVKIIFDQIYFMSSHERFLFLGYSLLHTSKVLEISLALHSKFILLILCLLVLSYLVIT